MNITNIFKWTYYFDDNLTLTFLGWGYWIILAFLVVCVVGAFVIPRKTQNLSYLKRQVWLRIGHLASLVGWLGLIWMFCRYEGLQYLSWRLWPTALIIYTIVRLVLLIKFVRVDFPKKRASKVTGQERDLYLRRYLGKK